MKTWAYSQTTGAISHDGIALGHGYSGFASGKNNPKAECLQAVGPIPRGKLKITRWDDQHGDKGPQVAVLAPVGHDAHGRSAFLIHGDSKSAPGTASHGCIILSRDLRDQIRNSGDTDLEVIT
jgi:hypothetical protein